MDLKRSVKARLDQYVDEAMEFADEHPLMLAQKDGADGLETPIAIYLPSRRIFVKEAGEASDFGLCYTHYMPSSVEGGEEEAIEEGKAHLEELLSAKGLVPFSAGAQERENEEEEEEEECFWSPLERGGDQGSSKAAMAARGGGGAGVGALSRAGAHDGSKVDDGEDDDDDALMSHVKGGATSTSTGDPTLFLGGAVLALIMALFMYLILK
uniref:Uncharacterized protein n=1 Tax=Chloropicon laureae TaxID=464258 RepID=A0A7S3E2B3_9CHLO|mmetsp:Transcript_3304/g.8297  ORF Transcript_3304/g.8297 Transcript_3304/m.8297 type:complete len:211 (+) Transcript_3304:2-634(+)